MENTDSSDLYLTGEGWQEWTDTAEFIRSIQRDAEIGDVKDETDVQGPNRRVSTHIRNVMQPKCEGLSIFLKLVF